MPLMIPQPTLARLRGYPFQPRYAFWGLACLTLLLAWPARRDTTRGALVLTVSLMLATMLLFTVR